MESAGILVINSILLGMGLAMDAFTVSIVNGIADPLMSRRKAAAIAGTFSFFQWLMPLLGYLLIRTAAKRFDILAQAAPWIALILLSFIGIRMIAEGIRERKDPAKQEKVTEVTGVQLLVQGIATSIDALSAGLALNTYDALAAMTAAILIAAVTFFICLAGVRIGRTAGRVFKGGPSLFGGVVLLGIGLEIFLTGVVL